MEQNTTSDERNYTINQLINAGASALFIDYYQEADKSASARSTLESGMFTLEKLNESPHLGGGFFQALWNGNKEKAFARADSKNLSILEDATGEEKAEVLGWETA